MNGFKFWNLELKTGEPLTTHTKKKRSNNSNCNRQWFNFYIFQVLISAFIGPSLVYYTLVYWVYPMKDYVGETGCHIIFFLRNAGVFSFQLQSLSMAIFRYICLFHSGSVRKLHISLNVSCKDQIMKPLCLCLQVLIRFHCTMGNGSFTYWIIVKMHVQL